MTKMHTKRRAARGAAFLDEKEPGWENQINPTTLDICSTGECVLGQLYGNFYYGMEALDIGSTKAGKLGMDADSSPEYVKLNEHWRREIKFRRELAVVLTETTKEKEKVDA